MAGKRQNSVELYPKHAVAMVTDFQHKSSKLQCSGEHYQCVMCPINFVFMSGIVQYNAKTLGSHLKIDFMIFKHRNHSWSFVVTRVYF
jgi:hypothetical protein